MNAAEYHPRSTLPGETAHLVSSKCVGGMDADADCISRRNGFRKKCFESFIHDQRIAITFRGSGRQYIKPSWSNYACPKGNIAGVNQVNTHLIPFLRSRSAYPKEKFPALRTNERLAAHYKPGRHIQVNQNVEEYPKDNRFFA